VGLRGTATRWVGNWRTRFWAAPVRAFLGKAGT
jgi:hypothetical protein